VRRVIAVAVVALTALRHGNAPDGRRGAARGGVGKPPPQPSALLAAVSR
jgi:hypothetical protein